MIAAKSAEPAPKTARRSRVKTPARGPEHPLHLLHETVGNAAVRRMFASGLLQAKLGIGPPGDRFEREADRVADRVLRMPEPVVQMKPG